MKRNRSWFDLITFCAAMGLASALGLAVLFAGASVAFAVGDDSTSTEAPAAQGEAAAVASEHTFTGILTDSHCGARHQMGSSKSPGECARMCVRNGSQYVLVDGEKKFQLQGNAVTLNYLAGQRVSVEGSLDGATINVSSIDAAPGADQRK